MKKLALALVCLISVAFFASCTPEGQPTISVLPGEEYVHDGDIINVNEEFNIGFTMSSSIETGSQLASFTLVIDDEPFETVTLEGTEYTFERTLALNTVDTRDDIDNVVITGTVTDVLGKSASVTMTLNLDETQELVAKDFEWYRLGNTQTGLDQFGLKWDGNHKATHARIVPVDSIFKLFIFEAADWTNINTVDQKAAKFLAAIESGAATPQKYENICTDDAGDKEYDDVIGTVTADGEYHLIHITHYHRGDYVNEGYPFTITGEAK
jgi:hypothetical protein